MNDAWRPFANPADVARRTEFFANPYSNLRMWMMLMNTLQHRSATRWDQLRFCLGMLQMAGAVVAGVLLIATGVTTASLLAVVFTSAASSISVVLFGSRGERPRKDR